MKTFTKSVHLDTPKIDYASVYLVLSTLIFLFCSMTLKGQVVVNEINPTTNQVELKNTGNGTVDISNYWLCDFPSYDRIGTLNFECGSINLGAGEIAVVTTASIGISGNDGEMGLYVDGSFGSSVSIRDYVEWGSTGHTRASVAVTAGIWTAGDFVPSFAESVSLEYDGEGNSSGDWAVQATPTLCSENGGNTCIAEGGMISTMDNTNICVDGNADPIDVTVDGASGANRGWIITDNANNILALPMAPPFDLDGAGVGVCLIWYIRYEDGLTGRETGNNLSDLDGCFDLSNSIEVNREVADGGTVDSDRGTSFGACAGNVTFTASHTTTANNLSYWYIITDVNDNILAWSTEPQLDLSVAPPGECHVWGWSYRGEPTPVVGDPISSLSDGDCESISSNFIQVIREVPDGGTVASDHGDVVVACAGNVTFNASHTTAANNLSYWYIITDVNDNILMSSTSPELDLSAAPAGECHIWGWSYRGLPDPVMGEHISTLNDDDCESISSNFIQVIRNDCGVDCNVSGGSITTMDNTTICVDGNPDPIDVTVDGASGSNRGWIITDNANNILALPMAPPFDLDGAGVGVCLIWYIRYDDGLTGKETGNNLTDLEGCFDLSNAIPVIREAADGGTVSSDHGDVVVACAGNVTFTASHTTTANNLSYWYIITDADDNILMSSTSPELDLSAAPPGECHVWGWSYRGEPNPVPGEPITSLNDGDCESISSNFIQVIRNDCGVDCNVSGGRITTMDRTSICVDGNPDPIDVTVDGASGPNRGWIITDNANNILALPMAPPFDLDGAGVGVCLIWYIRYDDGLMGKEAGNNLTDLEGCFDLSNAIQVDREAADGGTVSSEFGDSFELCAGDVQFTASHTTTANNLSYWYIITDADDNILMSSTSPELDLSVAPPGECHVWGWSYRGEPNPVPGEPITSLNDGDCESISSNFIQVIRVEVTGGSLSTDDETTVCTDDGTDDIVTVATSGSGSSYQYIITDDVGNILAGPADGPDFNFEGLPAGLCRIYGVAYVGDLTVGATMNDLEATCYELSDNSIDVTRLTGTSCITASTNIENLKTFEVYPNPVRQELTVSYTGLEAINGQLEFIDAVGKRLYSERLGSNSDSRRIDVTGFISGTYFIRIVSTQGVSVKKVLIID